MDPHCNGLNGKLKNVKKRAARFMTRNYSCETGSMTDILEELKWEILQLRKGGMIMGSYYCKKVCEVKFMQKSTLNRLVMQVKTPIRKASLPQTIREWNYLTDSLISAAELSDTCVSKFTSLLRARD